MSRNSQILTRVRLRLNQIDLQKIQDGEIYDMMNYVQSDIIQKTKCLEKVYEITAQSGSSEYYFPGSASVYIKSLTYFDPGSNLVMSVDYRNTDTWDAEFSNVSGSPCLYYTTFGNRIRVSPQPNVSGTLRVFGYQNELSYQVTSSAEEPEIPSIYDNALAYGILSEYDPNYFPQYQTALDYAAKTQQIKGAGALDTVVNW